MIFKSNKTDRDKTAYIRINTRLCQACWECVKVCRSSVIGKINFLWHKHARIDNAASCTGCRACLQACTHHAILPLS